MKEDRQKCKKSEEGQALIMVVLAIVVLMGIAALVIDVGILYVEKANMQKAADAAALAGARDLPNVSTAENTAKKYGQTNGADTTKPKVTSDKTKIEVECIKNVQFSFARVLGFTDVDVTERAVAEKKSAWTGEALPFINLNFDYSTESQGGAWTHVGSGLKGTLQDFRTIKNASGVSYFELEYKDGLTIIPGFSNGEKGLDNSKLMDGLPDVLNSKEKKVFLFSLKSNVIQSGKCKVVNEGIKNLDELKNKDVISPEQLVLIECIVVDYKDSNYHDIKLTYTGKIYDLGNNDPSNDLPDYPTENLSSFNGSAVLIE